MCELFQAWLEESINNIINIVFQNENKESNIENIIKTLSFKKNQRIRIDKFLKCPTINNLNVECISIVFDKCNFITATFSPSAIQKFKLKNPEIEISSLRDYNIILNKYNFNYDRKAQQLYLNIEEFNCVSSQITVYSNDIQFINDVPSIKAFITILNQKIREENNEDIYYYDRNDLNKISDDVSLVDRSILDDIPGKWDWSHSDSIYSEVLNNKNDNLIFEDDSLFNSQSIFEIFDINGSDMLYNNQDQNNESLIKKGRKTEKRYREAIDNFINSSENEMIIEEKNKQKRIKIENTSLNDENIFYSQPIDIYHESQDVNMEINSDLSDHLSVETDENLTNKFAPAGRYNSNNSYGSLSDSGESESDKEEKDTYIVNGDKNNKSFNINKIIEKANFYNQINSSLNDRDENLYISQNLESDNDNMSSDNYQIIWELN